MQGRDGVTRVPTDSESLQALAVLWGDGIPEREERQHGGIRVVPHHQGMGGGGPFQQLLRPSQQRRGARGSDTA